MQLNWTFLVPIVKGSVWSSGKSNNSLAYYINPPTQPFPSETMTKRSLVPAVGVEGALDKTDVLMVVSFWLTSELWFWSWWWWLVIAVVLVSPRSATPVLASPLLLTDAGLWGGNCALSIEISELRLVGVLGIIPLSPAPPPPPLHPPPTLLSPAPPVSSVTTLIWTCK